MSKDQILDNLSTHLKQVIANAISLATTLEHDFVTPLHFLYAIYEQKGCVGKEILDKIEIKPETMEKAFIVMTSKQKKRSTKKGNTKTATLPELNDNARSVLEKAMILAYEHEHKYVGTEHMFHGIMHVDDEYIASVLSVENISVEHIDKQIEVVMRGTSKFPSIDNVSEAVDELEQMLDQQHKQTYKPTPQKKQVRALDLFTKHLTNKKTQKKLDPIIGRDDEIERLIHILCRRTKNNPVLLGEPGVGKTAIVEGLAKKIVAKTVPPMLLHKKIYALDLALLISGTIYRGEFEARLKQLIDEITAQTDAILFIDELHNIIGAGSNQGTMDAANILKPALARGQLRCIGATTLDEYKKYITADPALDRRFQSIAVEEPSRDEAVEILKGLHTVYDTFHHTHTSVEAMEAAVDLSIKYIHDNHLPDKAIDLLDEAGARARLGEPVSATFTKHQQLEQTLEEVFTNKEEAIINEDFTKAEALKTKAEEISKQLDALEKKKKSEKIRKVRLTKKDIIAVLSKRIGIDQAFLQQDSFTQLATINKELKKDLFGQDHVIDTITKRLAHAEFKVAKNHKPFASFLFAGPSGVGKTATAKLLAETLYNDPKALVKFDMSEFSESHSTAKILGSPAGYIGHKERNRFTDALKKRPYSVIVFDEIDKAHGDVIKLLLQILDEGELTDSGGKKIYFDHSIIIMTTNVGAELYSSTGIGFGDSSTTTIKQDAQKQVVTAQLKERFSPALIGRLDAVCLFHELTLEHIELIIKKHVGELQKVIKQREGLSLRADKKAITQLAEESFDIKLGARNVNNHVSDIVCQLLLEHRNTRTEKTMTLTQKDKQYLLQ
ncbi:ATP-dependent Clp protease ATP-binding subunit [Patescibacteria group bacterium]|nr:ATP-dependent Clp protease ATP-binding subunit [Patescibacteria group bacterium]MBU1721913.1 ATP-dependent Clp protease ATP-binding subunit [Patescibacteria group bacterium]MBU1901206.1 ATP-dependent Clp protease ATP-binding subunit [Patescibacteria group bacterium]